MLIVEKEERVIAVCAGRPKHDETWDDLQQRASEILEAAGPKLNLGNQTGRRGNFTALPFGISYGGGQRHPKVLVQDSINEEVLEGLLKEEVFERISGFAAGRFLSYL